MYVCIELLKVSLVWHVGDDLYPEEVDFYGKRDEVLRIDMSLEDFQRESLNLHRIIIQDPYTASVHMNVSPKYNHLAPLFSETVGGHYKSSKLWHLPVIRCKCEGQNFKSTWISVFLEKSLMWPLIYACFNITFREWCCLFTSWTMPTY